MGPTVWAVATELKSPSQQDIHTEYMWCVELVLLLQQPQHSTRSSQSSLTWRLPSITTAAVRASRWRK